VRALLNRIELSTGVEHADNLEALNIKHIVCVTEQVFCVSHFEFLSATINRKKRHTDVSCLSQRRLLCVVLSENCAVLCVSLNLCLHQRFKDTRRGVGVGVLVQCPTECVGVLVQCRTDCVGVLVQCPTVFVGAVSHRLCRGVGAVSHNFVCTNNNLCLQQHPSYTVPH
jgi:hypothetical protein